MIKALLLGLFEGLIRNIGGIIGIKIRYSYYKRRLGDCGRNVVIDIGVVFQSPKDIYLGDNVWIDKYVLILAGKPNVKRQIKIKNVEYYNYKLGETHIGNGVHIAPFVVVQAHGGVAIGNKVGIASGSKLYSLSHHYRNLLDKEDKSKYYFTPMVGDNEQSLIAAPIVIGDGCAISLDSIILPGTVIPNGTWIGTNITANGSNYKADSVYFEEQVIHNKPI